MRLRRQDLKTGSLLARFAPSDRRHNASLLFLVGGAADIGPLQRIETACEELMDESFCWLSVVDHLDLAAADPCLRPENVGRIEAAELGDLDAPQIRGVLGTALHAMRAGGRPLFPSASGAVGAVAEGANFLDREEALTEIRRRIAGGESLLLVAPRRSGKTSVLRRLEQRMDGAIRYLYIDLEGHDSIEGAVARLRCLVRREPFGVARREVSRAGWPQALEQALTCLAAGPPIALMLDELVLFLEELPGDKALEFLAALGRACLQAKVLLIVAGSRDLDDFARDRFPGRTRADLPPPFGQLRAYSLPPLAEYSLDIELRRVLIGTDLVPEAGDMTWLKANLDLSMPYPALRFIAHLASNLQGGGTIDEAGLERELRGFLDHTDAFAEMDRCLETRGQHVPGAEPLLSEVLTMLARAANGVDAAEIAARLEEKDTPLLGWLLDTFPLRHLADGRITMASRIFRRWWLRREGIES